MNVVEMLQVTVEVPHWYLVAISLAGVLIGLGAFVLVDWVCPRLKRTNGGLRTKPKADVVVAPNVPGNVSGRTSTSKVASVALVGVLQQRATIGGGYKVQEAAAFLGRTIGDIRKLIKSGELSGYTDQEGYTWVTAQSMLDFMVVKEEPEASVDIAPDTIPVAVASEAKPESATEPESIITLPATEVVAPVSAPTPSGHLTRHARQWYRYIVDGKEYAMLSEALKAIPEYVNNDSKPRWDYLPVSIREKICREKVG